MFKTTFHTLVSGHERRNADWSRTRGEWDVAYGIQSKSDFKAVEDTFYASLGMAFGFRFKDWHDFEVGEDATDTIQDLLPVGDGVEQDFQAIKRYQVGAFFYDRTLTRLVTGAVRVFLDAVEQFAGFTVDLNTGIINFSSPPGGGVVVGLIAEFDIPVRFDSDVFVVSMTTFDAGSINSIQLVEIKEGP